MRIAAFSWWGVKGLELEFFHTSSFTEIKNYNLLFPYSSMAVYEKK
jgi:hypothetical protein